MADIMHFDALSYMSHSPPVTTVPDVAIHHMLRNKTTGEFKGELCCFSSTNSAKGNCKLMIVFKQSIFFTDKQVV